MKANVDALKIIQLGLTLPDEHGNLPDLGTNNRTHYIWQFNFRDFNLTRDIHAKDSVALLRSQGIDFACNAVAGVSSVHFAKLAAASGLLFNKALTWVTFHGAYDIGYLVKILNWGVLPTCLEEFLELVKELFGGNTYDVKHVIRFCNGLYGGLEKVADSLHVDRVAGKCHQAGSLEQLLLTRCSAYTYFDEDDISGFIADYAVSISNLAVDVVLDLVDNMCEAGFTLSTRMLQSILHICE
ncbi:probable CCR4-associated factor 1 homolog 11 [Arachis hypogaea]|uniref:probable CCR4-associated factor 1 homolog 11 n=1 Tax=Arachis hypogaea TaxID=3818 RepID=UPI003B20F103